MNIPLLNDILVIFLLSIVVLFLCHRLRVPAIVGFLLTGMLAGPHGLGLVNEVHQVDLLSEIGVVLLLFTIGIEFSLKSLVQIRKSVLLGGSLQVLATLAAAFLVFRQLGASPGESIFAGFLISLSSTAIVLKLMQERAEADSPHGRTAVAVLIFQDVIVVPMMLLTPLLAGGQGAIGESLLLLAVKAVLIVLLVIAGARWIVPRVLYEIARTRNRELFLLCVVAVCLAVAWLTSAAGLSLALGAFLAGLIISESEYSHQALGNLLPFRDVFISFFFVSIGMLLDLGHLLREPVLIVLLALGVLILKSFAAGAVSFLLGFPLRTAVLTGLALSQVGEFSFLLSRTGAAYGLLPGNSYQVFLAVAVLTMAATPFIIASGPRIADFVLRLPLPTVLRTRSFRAPAAGDETGAENHLVIVGYGVNGGNVARAARVAGIPYVIIEMNPDTVRREREKGEPIFYGDATHESVLRHANIKGALVVVVAISDPAATRRVTEISRRLNPRVYVIARTRFLREMGPLYDLGADEVIPEEYETSIEIFTRVLAKYLVPRDEIEQFITEVRSDGYGMLRTLSPEATSVPHWKLHLPDVEISLLRVGEKAPAAGRSLAQIELRNKYGVTLLAIRRDSDILSNPHGDMRLCARDALFLLGPPEKIARAAELFYDPQERPAPEPED